MSLHKHCKQNGKTKQIRIISKFNYRYSYSADVCEFENRCQFAIELFNAQQLLLLCTNELMLVFRKYSINMQNELNQRLFAIKWNWMHKSIFVHVHNWQFIAQKHAGIQTPNSGKKHATFEIGFAGLVFAYNGKYIPKWFFSHVVWKWLIYSSQRWFNPSHFIESRNTNRV